MYCEWAIVHDGRSRFFTLALPVISGHEKKSKSSLSQRAAEHPVQWGKKQRTGLLHRHPFERRSSSIKARGRQSRSTGFARDLVGSSRAQSQAVGRSIYIYIANDESSSQHVTVGLAEARPNNNNNNNNSSSSKNNNNNDNSSSSNNNNNGGQQSHLITKFVCRLETQ